MKRYIPPGIPLKPLARTFVGFTSTQQTNWRKSTTNRDTKVSVITIMMPGHRTHPEENDNLFAETVAHAAPNDADRLVTREM